MKLEASVLLRGVGRHSTRWARRLLPGAVVALAALFALRRLDDFDTWWHLASGRWIFANRAVPLTDTLSFTVPDHSWVNLQWLYDLTLYLLYRVGGPELLVLVSTAAYTAAVWLLMRSVRLRLGEVVSSVLVLWVVVIAEERFLIRPEMISLLLLTELLWLLSTADRDDGRRLWLLVPLMLLWANTHALFIVGLFCIGCTVAAELVAWLPVALVARLAQRRLSRRGVGRLLAAAACSAAIVVLNPYGVEGALFPWKLLSRINGSNSVFRAIGEFRRPFSGYFQTVSIGAYQLLIVASVIVVAVATFAGLLGQRENGGERRPARGLDLAGLAIFAGLAWLSLLARRNIAIFVFAATPFIGTCLARVGRRLFPGYVASRAGLDVAIPHGKSRLRSCGLSGATDWDMQARAGAVAPLVVLAACLVIAGLVVTNNYYRWDGSTRAFGLGVFEANFPIRAAAFASEHGLPAPLYNDLTSGGYLTWHPPVPGGVFIDGRLEVYNANFFSSYLSALSYPPAWQRQADEFGIETVVLFHRWGNRRLLVRWLTANPAWSLVYDDEAAVVFVRSQGNSQVIQRARADFPAWAERTRARLSRRSSPWQWPLERATALSSYGAMLFSIREPDAAIATYEQLLSLGLPPAREAMIRYQIAYHLARKGQLNTARMQLKVALHKDPGNKRVRQLLADLDG